MDHELDRLLFDVRERRPLQVGQHMRRHTEETSDFARLELPGFKELRVIRRDRVLGKRHPFLQKHEAM